MNDKLRDAIKSALNDIVATTRPPEGEPSLSTYSLGSSVGTTSWTNPRRNRVLVGGLAFVALATAAVAIVGPLQWSDTGQNDHSVRVDGPGTTAGGTATSGPATTTAEAIEQSATCGPSIPATFTLVTAGGAPAETESRQITSDGQLVDVAAAGSLRLELLWPAPAQPLYADAGAATERSAGPESASRQGAEYTLNFRGTAGAFTVMVSDSSAAVDGACGTVAVVLSDGAGTVARFNWQLGPSFDGDSPTRSPVRTVEPRIRRSEQVAAAPDGAIPCQGPGGGNRFGDAAVEPQPTPAQALDAFLRSDEAATFYQSGFIEMIVAGDRYVYGAPFENGPGTFDETRFVTLITVEQVAGGWAATSWTASGC